MKNELRLLMDHHRSLYPERKMLTEIQDQGHAHQDMISEQLRDLDGEIDNSTRSLLQMVPPDFLRSQLTLV